MSTNPSNLLPKIADAQLGQTWDRLRLTPRKWQAEALPIAVNALREQWEAPPDDPDVVRPIVQAIMGAGKSIFIAAAVSAALEHTDDAIVVTAPRRMLVRQLARTLSDLLPLGYVGRFDGKKKQPGKRVIVTCDASTSKLADWLSQAGRKVGLWIADECHGSEADRMKRWCSDAQPHARLGLTATPRRASDDEVLSLWTSEIYRYDAAQAMADGVVVKFTLRHWQGDTCDIDQAITEMIVDIVREGVGPGVVDARDIKDAETFCKVLSDRGLRCGTVHCRLKPSVVTERLAQLRDGKLDVIVHVSMLKEGVDMPWLMWLALRRQVSSKVYFAQHVGRALRAHEGKEEAIILDPGHLFEKHKINLEAILELDVHEGDEEEPELPITGEEVSQIPREASKEGAGREERVVAFAVSMDKDISSLQRLFVQMETQGLVERGSPGYWRNKAPTNEQLWAIYNAVRDPSITAALQAHPDAEMFRRFYLNHRRLDRGGMSDLLSVIFGIAKAARRKAA